MFTAAPTPAPALSSSPAGARASWDTSPGPKPLVTTTRILKPPRPSAPPATELTVARPPAAIESPAQLLSSTRFHANRGKSNEQYLGYERWLPVAPQVKKPRSIYNAASLAYMGDCVYELYARRHFLYPPLSINEYNDRVMKVVRCEAQDALLKKLLSEDYLTEEERDVLRWGKNIDTSKTRTKRRAGVAVYNRASSLETLIGYLYLTDVKRLEAVMYKLGFFTGASSDLIVEELRKIPEKQPAASVASQTVINP